MIRIRFGAIGVLLALAACGKEEAGPSLPVPVFLSPEGVSHTQSAFSPDGNRVAYWTPGPEGFDLIVAKADLSDAHTASSHNTQTSNVIWSPDSRQFAVATSDSGIADIMIIPADGGSARRLTSAPGFEFPTSWHPRGGWLTHTATGEGGVIKGYLVDLATGGASALPITGPTPVARWSPDGKRLSLEAVGGGTRNVWIADSVGQGAKQLTTDGQETDARWSPDGTELAYVSRRTGTGDIWVIGVDGGAPRQLTRDIREDFSPRWSPDGKWIAFISQRGRQTDVWVVPAAGGPEVRVTDDAAEEGNPQWIGTSRRLAYHTGSNGTALWAITVSDGKERRLTPDSLPIGPNQDISPDGAQLVYEVVRGGGVTDLQVMPMAGGPARTLVTGTSFNQLPSFSPDGKSIVFLSNRSGSSDLWIIPTAGGTARQLTDWPTQEGNAQWSADGSEIYFTSNRDAAPFNDIWKVPAAGGAPVRITTTGGAVNGLAVSRVNSEVFIQTVGGKGGKTVLSRVLSDAKLETLFDRTNVTGISWFGFTPKGDSMAINAELPGGGPGSYLISTKTGQGRQLLGKGEQIGDFSRDGRWLGYWSGGTATLDLGVIDMKDGSIHQLTKTPESEISYWWSGDNNTIVFARQSQRRRIATVDLTKLLAAAKP